MHTRGHGTRIHNEWRYLSLEDARLSIPAKPITHIFSDTNICLESVPRTRQDTGVSTLAKPIKCIFSDTRYLLKGMLRYTSFIDTSPVNPQNSSDPLIHQ
jgi:hypothetical protein